MTQTRTKTLIFGTLALLIAAIMPVRAADFSDSPCDYDGYFESLKARAWMEAQREMTQNQNLIQKQDSVLQYSCFDSFARDLAVQAANMLSESSRWGDVDLGGVATDKHMDSALEGAVGGALSSYLTANYNHTLLGGRGAADPTPNKAISPASGAYRCETMNAVWNDAQCGNFNANAATDGFLTFEDYESGDKHFNSCADDGVTDLWKQANADALKAPPWDNDPMNTYAEELGAEDCGGSIPIPTGITVKRSKDEPTEFKAKFCIKPGCNYVPTGLDAGSCEEN